MLICRKRASRCPIFLFGRMPRPNDGSHSTFSSNAISVPGNRQTATCGSSTAAKPRVMELLNLVVTSLSSIWAGRFAPELRHPYQKPPGHCRAVEDEAAHASRRRGVAGSWEISIPEGALTHHGVDLTGLTAIQLWILTQSFVGGN